MDKRNSGGKQRKQKIPDLTQKEKEHNDKTKKTIILYITSGTKSLYSMIPRNLLE